ncbi:trypsin-like peptidase domain-containing protein [Rhizobium laguerreae]|uniref:trypsin-like serine peptidase n=1 Tax=Rhizobium laguerreae TaxID=1076926 RepID=UPI001C90BED4|nr:trypsin-like peptidase domain-containing protein [Rhizobium laguerreae]MBY3235282.1 trypsin-like peptidase domain-containing protein [Rhizobium laguerreae]
MPESAADLAKLVKLAKRIAELVNAPRSIVRQLFDTVVTERKLEAPNSFLHAVLLGQIRLSRAGNAELNPAKDGDALALALLALGGRQEMAGLLSSAIALGLFDRAGDANPAGRRDLVWRKIISILGHRTRTATRPDVIVRAVPHGGVVGRAQTVIDMGGTWTNPEALHPAIVLAMRRICRIRAVRADSSVNVGSGLLIGPAAVLTNWHIVEGVPEKLPSPNLLAIQFQISRSGHPNGQAPYHFTAAEWLIAHQPMGNLLPPQPIFVRADGETRPWWEDAAMQAAWAQTLASSLDFAIIRLKEPLGLERGYYDLTQTPGYGNLGDLAFSLIGSCHAFHYPGNQDLSFSSGSFEYAATSSPNRIFHKANTTPGSSGGLLLDSNGQPVALHHAGYDTNGQGSDTIPNVGGDMAINGAIPLATIYTALSEDEKEKVKAPGKMFLVNGSLVDRRPVFGRQNLIDKVDAVAKGDLKRFLQIMVLDGLPAKPGKTFTVDILRTLLPPPKDVFVVLTPDKIKESGVETAELILKEAVPGIETAFEGASNTTEAAFFADNLIEEFSAQLKARLPGKRLWLVIDELDVKHIPDTSGRTFLDILYSKLSEIPELRIVLIGLKSVLASVPTAQLELCPLGPDEFRDLANIVERWLDQKGLGNKGIHPQVGMLLAKFMTSAAGGTPTLEELSNFVRRHLDGPLDDFLGRV